MTLNISTTLRLSAAPLAIGLALLSTPTFAQAVPATAPPADDAASVNTDIVVTGSLIRNPNLVQTNPVAVINASEIGLKQANTAETLIRDIPGVTPSIGSGVNNGTNGAAYVDLRGLGYNRNIVVLDGNRIVPTGLIGSVDLNSIPLALIDRVDVQTGAAVTTYGADAITGVVNFITKKHFKGLEIGLSDQITGKGDGNYVRADVTMGGDFAEGKGNAVLSVGYQKSDPVYQGARDFSQNAIDSFYGSAGGSGTSTPTRFLTGVKGSINPTTGAIVPGYVPYNFNPYNLLQTGFKRYNIFAQTNYEISDNVEAYGRFLYSRTTVLSVLAPAGIFSQSVVIPYSNPYLPVAARNQFCGANGLTAAQCTAAAAANSPTDPNFKTFTTTLRRRMPEAGNRDYTFTTDTFDFNGGFRGKISDTINWDLHGAYGESNNNTTTTGYVRVSRVLDALYATGTGCISGNAGCVPLNLFGATGSITPAQIGYISAPGTTTQKTSLGQVHGQISGDFGLHTPFAATPISFAVGAEYRTYSGSQNADVLSQIPGEFSGTSGSTPVFGGSYRVYEGFAELVAPLVEDKPFFHNLTADAGGRYSSYKVSGNTYSTTTKTYKGGLNWEPVIGVKLRANYAHAVRAPNLNELFLPVTTSLTNLAIDPCAGSAPVNNATLKAVCIAQRAPASSIGQITNPSGAQANYYGGGSTSLKPETANTWTAGAVFQPVQVHGLSASFDYYHIVVKSEIGTPLPGDAINACFGGNNLSPTNPACLAILRDPTDGQLDGSAATTPGIPLSLSNLGRLQTKGFDFTLNYQKMFGDVKYSLSLNGNHTISQTFMATPSSVNRECVGYFSANCGFTGSLTPAWQLSLRNTVQFRGAELSVLWRHLSGFKQEPLAVSEGDQNPAYVGTLSGVGALSGETVNFGKINPYNLFDLTTRFSVMKSMVFTVLVQNVFNKLPPLVGYNIGSTAFNSGNTYPSTYDALGRRFTVSATVKY